MDNVHIQLIPIEKPEELNMILGQSHFIKTVEDISEVMATAGGHIAYGLAFCEASGPRLVRYAGNREDLIQLAQRNALSLGTGHAFILFMEQGFPIQVLNQIKNVPEVCRIYCATANPVEVIVAESQQGRGIMGVIDGGPSEGIEGAADIENRHQLLRTLGYKA